MLLFCDNYKMNNLVRKRKITHLNKRHYREKKQAKLFSMDKIMPIVKIIRGHKLGRAKSD